MEEDVPSLSQDMLEYVSRHAYTCTSWITILPLIIHQ